jgi:hypothetical protein
MLPTNYLLISLSAYGNTVNLSSFHQSIIFFKYMSVIKVKGKVMQQLVQIKFVGLKADGQNYFNIQSFVVKTFRTLVIRELKRL